MGEQEVISPATPTVTSPKKQGSWFSRSTSKLPTPRTPSTSGSHGFFHHRTPLTHSPEEENAALEALKARIRQDTEEWHFWLDHAHEDVLRRILRARSCEAEASFTMWHNLSRWRMEYRPEALTEADTEWYMSKGIITKCGPDRRGRPASYVDGKKHFPEADRLEDTMKAVVYLLENESKESSKSADGYLCIILDNAGVGRRNLDTHLFVMKGGVVHVLQDYYPERLGTALVLNASLIFRMMWAVISPFLHEKTRSKVKVLSRTDDVLQYVAYENLPPQVQQQIKKKPLNAA